MGIGEAVWIAEEQVACCLGGPGAGRVCGDSGEEHFLGGDVDEGQQVVAAQESGVDAGEFAGDGGLGFQELGPSYAAAVWCGIDAVVFENLPDGGCSDVVDVVGDFAVDAPVAPGGVIGGHLKGEPPDLRVGWWPSGFVGWLGPVFGDASAVLAKECVGGGEPASSEAAGECLAYSCEQARVIIVERRPFVLAVKDPELVA